MQIHADFRQAQFLRGDQPVESIGKPILGAIEDRAENFYAKMPKPEPPQGESALEAAQKLQECVQVSPSQTSKPTASRDAEAPDGLAEMPVAKIDERRRQEEADRANRVYALSMDTDGPRFDEPVTVRFDAEIADDIAANLKTAFP
jgi:hypothetical protein